MSTSPHKPHPDAVLVHISTGEVSPFPEGRARDVAEDIMDARTVGYSVAVPVVKTCDGLVRYCAVEPQNGGVAAVERLLRSQRQHNGRPVPVAMLASEWERLGDKKRAELLISAKPADPRDEEIARLKAQLAAKSDGSKVSP